MSDADTGLVALNRFGFGARPGDLVKIQRDPRGFLRAELAEPGGAIIAASEELLGSSAVLRRGFAELQRRKMERALEATENTTPALSAAGQLLGKVVAAMSAAPPAAMPAASGRPAAGDATMMAGGTAGRPAAREPNPLQAVFRAEAAARFDKVAHAQVGFVERMVHFWSNHFCVSVRKGPLVRVSAGALEREAIRPFVVGRFADMLRAVTRHPAMLIYLDNRVSIGPDSPAGRNRGRGLNENLAREILELHTLGADGGYTQADVTAFARVLTGWTLAGPAGRLGEPGSFVFNVNAHEPGEERVLGKTYPNGGEGQGATVLDDIAHHPSTARHIATKFARHFVADDPPPALVARLSRSFQESGGDLMVLASTLLESPEAWVWPPSKIRSPADFLLAARRALPGGPMADARWILNGLNLLGQPLWAPPGPNGFADTASAWVSAESMKTRLDIAARIGKLAKDVDRPETLVDAILGAGASRQTRTAIARAETRQQAVAILLMSPEFQRR